MKPRMEYWKVAPGAFKAMSSLEAYLRESGLDKGLLHMVKLRASQMNGCAYCIDMHWKDARAGGESEQRLYGLDAWREAPYYSDRERAALEWTEALTNITDGHVPGALYDAVRGHFSEKELADLTWAVAGINAGTASPSPSAPKPARTSPRCTAEQRGRICSILLGNSAQ